jgi:multiple sugar transport system substrate-binding protein
LEFYQKNPLFSNGVKVTQTIVDNLSRLVEQKATPEETLADASRGGQRLLPRK